MRKKNRKYLLAASAAAVAIVVTVFFTFGYANMPMGLMSREMPSEMVHTENPKFIELSNEGNSACFGPDFVYSMDDSERLTGSCCGPMSQHRYEEQVEGLKKYSHIKEIPSDPYDLPVDLVKELLDYDSSITLSADQQEIYNGASSLSNEGGPCCCKCWRWDVYEGLAKFLITEHEFTAEQVAEVWNLSDGCGGEQHGQDHV